MLCQLELVNLFFDFVFNSFILRTLLLAKVTTAGINNNLLQVVDGEIVFHSTFRQMRFLSCVVNLQFS